jgi:hypothetical protein
MKKYFVLILLGLMNILHAGLHLIQAFQSFLLIKSSINHEHHHNETWIDSVLHNPIFALFWGIIGIFTLWIGIKDFIYHKQHKCKHQ